MLECKITERAEDTAVVAVGDLPTLSADTIVIIRQIHRAVQRNNQKAAADYVRNIVTTLVDPDSPFWKEYENEQQEEES